MYAADERRLVGGAGTCHYPVDDWLAGCAMSRIETMTPDPGAAMQEPGDGRRQLDVVVRTLAQESRQRELLRALDSIQGQASFAARPILVVNGNRYHPPLLEELRQRRGVLFHYLPEASAGRALAVGRELVTAPYFMFLDDDDELLGPGLERLAEHMSHDPDWDVIVTNGYGCSNGEMRPWVPDLMAHAIHPVRSLMAECWLSPGAAIFRSEAVSSAFLDVKRDYHEWTYIAFLLIMDGKRVRFLDVPTVTYYDTQHSASKSFAYEEAALELLDTMKAEPRLDGETLAIMEKKYRNTLHTLAFRYWRRGARRKAWRYHMRSMRPPFTMKYLLFSRKLLLPTRSGPC